MDQREWPFEELDVKKNPIIYHYCSTKNFLSIIRNKSVWMSDINTMNDFSEMHWAYGQFERAATEVMPTVGREFLDEVDAVIGASQLRLLPMIAAFSTDGDVLSQWRAYAADGEGVALGFDSNKMLKLSVRCSLVEYSSTKQIEYISNRLLAMHTACSSISSAKKRSKFLFERSALLANDLAFFKNPAFSEESEFRIIRAVNVLQTDGRWSLNDAGGPGERVSSKKLPVRYRAGRQGGIISYVELPLSGLGNDLIRKVIIGPRSVNNGIEVSMALSECGYNGFEVENSQATYR